MWCDEVYLFSVAICSLFFHYSSDSLFFIFSVCYFLPISVLDLSTHIFLLIILRAFHLSFLIPRHVQQLHTWNARSARRAHENLIKYSDDTFQRHVIAQHTHTHTQVNGHGESHSSIQERETKIWSNIYSSNETHIHTKRAPAVDAEKISDFAFWF